MKRRAKRRYLTKRYQAKQIRLYYQRNGRPYDPDRHNRTERNRKFHFVCFLKGEFALLEKDAWVFRFTKLTLAQKGRFRKHSYKDCGVTRCPMCGNPRRTGFYKSKDRLTHQELVAQQQLEEGLNEYYEGVDDEN